MILFTQFTSRTGFVTETIHEPPRYLSARTFATITAKELPDAVRLAEVEPNLGPETVTHEPAIETLLGHLNEAVEESFVPPASISINRPAVR